MPAEKSEKKEVITSCPHDCGGRCVLRVQVENGIVKRIETDNGEEPQLRACARGRAYRQRVYSPERLKYPMVRTGKRGTGEFKRVSWDEALEKAAGNLIRIKKAYGNEAIIYIAYSGNTGTFLHNQLAVFRLLTMFGGFTPVWGSASFWASLFSSEMTYGTITAGHTPDDITNAKYIIMWGWNPAETIQRTNTSFYLAMAKEKGIDIISIDPRYTDSAAAFASKWIPIKPGTDTAMLVAMAYVMIKEDLYEKDFIGKYTTGFEKFSDYVLGRTDGVEKSPKWAEQITGVRPDIIESVARNYSTIKPSKLLTLGAPGRTAYGEQFHRAASTIAAMAGNIGIYGGEPAGFGLSPVGLKPVAGTGLIERDMPGNLPEGARQRPAVHITKIWDAILKGASGGYPADLRMAYITNSNALNQFMNTNKAVSALESLESIVVHEQFMTPTAMYADVLLPVNTQLERNDIIRPWQGGSYCIYMNKAIEPLYESRSDLDICSQLAELLGIKGYSSKSEDEWLEEFWQAAQDMTDTKPLPDYQTLKNKGCYKWQLDKPVISFKSQVDDLQKNPFPTPSGRIEIYSEQIEKRNVPGLSPLPIYIEPWEGVNDPLSAKYPLQLISTHSKRRIHSNMHNISWLRDLEPHKVWINSKDAKDRGIKHGDTVTVFNERGRVVIKAKVTERIMPGVVSIGQGAWFKPDDKGVDTGGCVNVLLDDRHSPAGAFCSNTCLVEIEKQGE